MLFWFSQIFVFLLYGVLLTKVDKRNWFWWISLIHFSFLAMFRSVDVGIDTSTYARIYLHMAKPSIHNLFSNQLSGFFLLLYPIEQLFPYDWMWMVLSGALSNVCVWVAIRFLSNDWFFSAFLYLTFWFYFDGLNTGRQSMAMGACMLAIVCMQKKRYLLSIIPFFIGVLFHPGGAIAALLFYPLSLITWDIGKYLKAAITAFLLAVSFDTLEYWFKSFFSYYRHYSYMTWTGKGRMLYIYIILLVFMGYSVLVLEQFGETRFRVKQFLVLDNISGIDPETCDRKSEPDQQATDIGINLHWTMSVMLTIQLVTCIFLSKYVFVERAFRVVEWCMIFYIPNILFYKTKATKTVKIMVMMLALLYLYLRLKGNYGEVIPYRTFFKESLP